MNDGLRPRRILVADQRLRARGQALIHSIVARLSKTVLRIRFAGGGHDLCHLQAREDAAGHDADRDRTQVDRPRRAQCAGAKCATTAVRPT